jgi:hypothetical protein
VARYQAAVNAADQFSAARRERLYQAAEGIPALLWGALILGASSPSGSAFSSE